MFRKFIDSIVQRNREIKEYKNCIDLLNQEIASLVASRDAALSSLSSAYDAYERYLVDYNLTSSKYRELYQEHEKLKQELADEITKRLELSHKLKQYEGN